MPGYNPDQLGTILIDLARLGTILIDLCRLGMIRIGWVRYKARKPTRV